jgi:microcystin-dependent protein
MSEQFVAEIRIFAGNFAPTGWALCNGQLIPISQNTALFSLLGTMYGGDGKSTFALPNLQGCAPLGFGQGPGLSDYVQGQSGGSSTVTLITSEMPAHNHPAANSNCSDQIGDQKGPAGNVPAIESGKVTGVFLTDAAPQGAMAPDAMSAAGGSLPHNNMQPYLVLTFIIAQQGIYPPR